MTNLKSERTYRPLSNDKENKMFASELKEMDKNKRVALSELGYDFGITKEQAEAAIWKLAADELKPAINQYINQGVK